MCIMESKRKLTSAANSIILTTSSPIPPKRPFSSAIPVILVCNTSGVGSSFISMHNGATRLFEYSWL